MCSVVLTLFKMFSFMRRCVILLFAVELFHHSSQFQCLSLHYENTPMQRFLSCKNLKISVDFFYIFLIFAQNRDCGYTLEPPRRGGSNEYPQSMFWTKNKKNRCTPANPSFFLYKSGVSGGIHYTDMFS